jgi:DNA-binding transcriptional regulator YiaG
MKKTKFVKEFAYTLAGFPVVVEHVKVVVTGEGEFPLLDYEELDRHILVALATKPTKLTGNQVRFIRHSFELSLRDFAGLFRFKGSSACNWEKCANKSTSMEWPTELLLRTEVLIRFADEETAMQNWRNLNGQTLPAAPVDEQIRIAPCPPVRVVEAPAIEAVWSESPNIKTTYVTSLATEMQGSVHYGGERYGQVPACTREESSSNAFAYAV